MKYLASFCLATGISFIAWGMSELNILSALTGAVFLAIYIQISWKD